MNGRIWCLYCILVLFAPSLGICASVSSDVPSDLTLTSVQAVDGYDQMEMPTPAEGVLIAIAKDRDVLKRYHLKHDEKKSHELLLKIGFSSRKNLDELAKERGASLRNWTSLCNGPRDKDYIELPYPYIFWRGLLLGMKDDPPLKREGGEATAFSYYIYIGAEQLRTDTSNHPLPTYDLRRKPEDLCFYVAGYDASGGGYRSNNVVISAKAIAAALQQVPPALR